MLLKKSLLTVILSISSAGATYYFLNTYNNTNNINSFETHAISPSTFVSNTPTLNNSTDFTKSAQSTVNSVVHVKSLIKSSKQSKNPYSNFYWGGKNNQNNKPVIGSGSGVIITADGYIVTNNHVIDKSEALKVILNNKKTYNATIVGTDEKTDIALLKIDAEDLPYITLSNSDNIKLGEWVLAVGNPFNLTSTVTAGIISAIGRDIQLLGESGIESFIQTDAVVNPGNSGGALVNTNGELIGINTAISTHTGSFEGYSFAVPSNIVKKVVEDIIEYGIVQRAYLGINIMELNSEVANKLDIDRTEGIYISGLSNKGFAENSGLQKGDIIYKINNKQINSFADLRGYLASKRPGDIVDAFVYRENKTKLFNVKLCNSAGTTELNKYVEKDISSILNADFIPLTETQKYSLGIRGGVIVKNIKDGALKNAGMKNGYIILRIQNKWINNEKDIIDILKNQDKAVLVEIVKPNGYVDYFALKLK
ncbi:MAG: trypsin-like peptidase domain-containing protein [Ichthyobacteriaceae bacterium]|nr:trypsin-like peptidase domain-containing protein [Ichthyobacteriaceae bacterium]